MSEDLDDLMRHMEWADALVWSEALTLTPPARRDPQLRRLLCHVHAVQWAYLQLWREESVEIHEPSEFGDLGEIQSWGRKYYEELQGTLARLDAEALARTVEFPWAEELAGRYGRLHPTSLRRSILQIASHSTYHRGQINTRIRALGGEPPLVDFVAWVWAGGLPAAWG